MFANPWTSLHLTSITFYLTSRSYGKQPKVIRMNKMNSVGLQRRGGGMQVHSVPDGERAVDANGVRLPWAYEYAE